MLLSNFGTKNAGSVPSRKQDFDINTGTCYPDGKGGGGGGVGGTIHFSYILLPIPTLSFFYCELLILTAFR